MKHRPIEIRFAWNQPDGNVMVHSGIYLLNTTTLQEVYDFVQGCSNKPDFIELHMEQFEDDDDD